MRLTPGRLMLGSLVAGVAVIALGAFLGGRTSPVPVGGKTYRVSFGAEEDAWCEPWVGRVLWGCRFGVAACGLSFIAGSLWLARRETREEPRADRDTAFPLADERRRE